MFGITSKAKALLSTAAAGALLCSSFVATAQDKDIVVTAVDAGNFSTLAAALEAADLVATLQGEGPYTVFAPTDEAFANLPEGTLEMLLEPENKDQLIAILTYHVVAGKVTAEEVVTITEAKTVNGKMVDIAVDGDVVTVEGAKVIQADVDASNGTIHVIDAVMIPE